MPLTDTHLVLLSAASQRDDGLLPRPAKLAGITVDKVRGSLTRAGAVAVVPVRADQPAWTKDEAEMPLGLRITPAGLAAIGIEPPPLSAGGGADDTLETSNAAALKGTVDAAVPSSSRLPRPGSKQAQLIDLLTRSEAVSIAALVTALGWQPHTVRAALTRLRQSGHTLTARKNPGQGTMYRIAADEAGA